jgi:hypothetical protein
MRRLLIALAISVLMALGIAAPAGAHVHGITPLSCLDENPNSGGNRADDVSPVITGLIPAAVGNAPLMSGDGGRDAAPCQE